MRSKVESYKVLSAITYRGRVIRAGVVVRFKPSNAKKFVEQGKMIKINSLRFVDVTTARLRLPKEVVMLGSGPNGVEHYDKLNGKFVAAFNKAILAPVDAAIWAAQDPTLKDLKWFDDKCKELRETGRRFGLTEFINGEYPMPFFDKRNVAKYYPWFGLTFTVTKPMINPKNIDLKSRRIVQGATICGSFMQVAIKLGVKRIILCGVDMFGNVYFDGSKHKQQQRKGKKWSSLRSLDALCAAAQKAGIEVLTVSKTALTNPVYVENI